jgi:hypothetical protein
MKIHREDSGRDRDRLITNSRRGVVVKRSSASHNRPRLVRRVCETIEIDACKRRKKPYRAVLTSGAAMEAPLEKTSLSVSFDITHVYL